MDILLYYLPLSYSPPTFSIPPCVSSFVVETCYKMNR